MPLILPRDPQSAMEAATKNYVDRSLSDHADNVALHMTPAQNAWLDAITVTAEEVNAIGGLSGNVVEQLTLKLDKAGGTITAALSGNASSATVLTRTTATSPSLVM